MSPTLRAAFALISIICVTGISGCASVTVHDHVAARSRQPSEPPRKIYVTEFTYHARDFRVNRTRQAAAQVASETSALLAKQVVQGLNQKVAPTVLVKAGARLPEGSWVLRGQFLRVNSGSASLRILIGLGAGGSKMETRGLLSQVGPSGKARAPFLRLQTTGGSGAEVGLISIPLGGPVGGPMLIYDVGSTVYSGASKGVNDDASRTARMIVAATSEYMAKRGFRLRGKPLEAKHDWTATVRGH